MNTRLISTAVFAAFVVCGLSVADDDSIQLDAPKWVNPADGFEATLQTTRDVDVADLSVVVRYAASEALVATVLAGEVPGTFLIDAPAAKDWGYGPVEIEVTLAADGNDLGRTFSVPASFFKDIDVTGPAAVELLHPLPDSAAEVRYIPCCNIYGGQTLAERIPVNPYDIDTGLPKTLISDFVVLEPDGLSASTMGLYFDFRFDGEDIPADRVALYEWTEFDWQEVFEYDVNPEDASVAFHCPDGGTFVVGLRDDAN